MSVWTRRLSSVTSDSKLEIAFRPRSWEILKDEFVGKLIGCPFRPNVLFATDRFSPEYFVRGSDIPFWVCPSAAVPYFGLHNTHSRVLADSQVPFRFCVDP